MGIVRAEARAKDLMVVVGSLGVAGASLAACNLSHICGRSMALARHDVQRWQPQHQPL
jgi:thiamine monophosphate kinase